MDDCVLITRRQHFAPFFYPKIFSQGMCEEQEEEIFCYNCEKDFHPLFESL